MWLRHVRGDRRPRTAATRTAGALVVAAAVLTTLGAAAPAAVDTPAPAPVTRHFRDAPHPRLTGTRGDSHTLLYGGFAAALGGLGALAVAAARSRRG